ncbi:MAG: hypothetical protein KGI06_05845 [Candidatus Micrarchaeota archaeon]|nr:hypothetical protein [Candidatus Micrarchaeota archaeon]
MSQQPPTFKVIQLIKIPSQDPTRLGKLDALVTYTVNGKGRFTIKIPSENLNENNLKAAIKADYQKEIKLHTLEFT